MIPSQWLPVTTNRIMAFVSKGSQPEQTQSFPNHKWVVVATQIFLYLHPGTWGNDPIWRSYFSKGLVKKHQLDNSAKWDVWETVGACDGEELAPQKNYSLQTLWQPTITKWSGRKIISIPITNQVVWKKTHLDTPPKINMTIVNKKQQPTYLLKMYYPINHKMTLLIFQLAIGVKTWRFGFQDWRCSNFMGDWAEKRGCFLCVFFLGDIIHIHIYIYIICVYIYAHSTYYVHMFMTWNLFRTTETWSTGFLSTDCWAYPYEFYNKHHRLHYIYRFVNYFISRNSAILER